MADKGGKRPPLQHELRGGSVADIRPGADLAGRYRIGEVVGRGGMALVYRGHDTLLDRDVAIKVFAGTEAGASRSNQEFLHEARLAAGLSHPSIVGVFDAGVHGSERFIVMEYVPGPSLFEEIRLHAPLPVPQAVGIASQLADALDYGHRRGIVHCDVKPQNVLLDENGRPKLVDFGISSTITGTGALTETITGTAGYIAPEQLLGERVDGRADVYSLGCVVYEMLSGDLPFDASNLAALATQRLVRRPFPLAERNANLPPALVRAVMGALERDRESRYSSAKDFADALGQAISGMPIRSAVSRTSSRTNTVREMPRATHVDRPPEYGRQRPATRDRLFWPLALLFLLILVLVGALAALALPPLFSPSPAATVTVPSVTGQRIDQATQTIHGLGLTIDPKLQDSSQCTGTVLSQSPSPQAQTHKGGSVVLVISVNAGC